MSNTAHHDWVDSCADWAMSHPITQRAHRALPQRSGACDQGRRDCARPTGRPMPAEACTEVGADAGADFDNADRAFYVYTIAGLAVWAVVITVWLGVA